MKICLITLFFLMVGLTGYSQKTDFFKEDLTFKLGQGLFVVDGLYYFRNTTDAEVRQILFYPFPDVGQYGEIGFIEITKVGDTISQLASQTTKGALFKVQIPANNEITYHIIYGQKLKTNLAKYIITTTQKWGKPFEEADYKLEIPESVTISSFSIAPDTVIQKDKFKIYSWSRKDFMPVTDFDFTF